MADIEMPQLGETVTEGTVTRWFKAVGDPVAEDEVLFEVSTDKVDSEVPSPVAGYLAEIKVPEGETVDVGTVLAVVSDAPVDGAAPAQSDEAAAPPPPPASGCRLLLPPVPGPVPAPPPEAAAPPPPPAARRPDACARRPGACDRALAEPVGWRGQGALAGRAAPHRRARARSERHPGHRRGWADHPQRRAAGHRVGLGPAAPVRSRDRHAQPPGRAGPALGIGRHGREAQQHPPHHRRAHGAVEGHLTPRHDRGRGRLRGGGAGAHRPSRVVPGRRGLLR